MMGPLRVRLGVILAVTAVFSLSYTTASANEPAAGRTPANSTNKYEINEDAALDLVWDVAYLTEFRTDNPDARLVLTVTGTPDEETGRWCIKAMTDEGTHYSTVGIYFIDAAIGEITNLDPVTGEELPVDNP
jgi:hypothetical protein